MVTLSQFLGMIAADALESAFSSPSSEYPFEASAYRKSSLPPSGKYIPARSGLASDQVVLPRPGLAIGHFGQSTPRIRFVGSDVVFRHGIVPGTSMIIAGKASRISSSRFDARLGRSQASDIHELQYSRSPACACKSSARRVRSILIDHMVRGMASKTTQLVRISILRWFDQFVEWRRQGQPDCLTAGDSCLAIPSEGGDVDDMPRRFGIG